MSGKASKVVTAEPRPVGPKSARGTVFVPQTELGRRLWSIRKRIVVGGQPLLDWEDLEAELRVRRGEAAEAF
ncbi:MAG TPA: hypothetical protein VFA18_19880 [Gemmataceae bacterium]|nr:hypothetical protein [Gemmataceae bacterium]